MKKIITSVGCLALGVAGLNAAYVFPNTGSVDPSKLWSASVALRGFYDDNPTTVHSHEQASWGFEARPNLAISLYPQGQTSLGLTATYSMKYYFERDNNRTDNYVDVVGTFDHAFNERFRMNLTDWFTYAAEPDVTDGGLTIRAKGNYLRNRVASDLNGELTEKFGFELGQSSTVWRYDQSGVGSYAALLDRMEYKVHLDLRYHLKPQMVGLIGYQFGYNDYSGNGVMYYAPTGPVTSEVRNNYMHYVYVGLDSRMSSKFTAAMRIGAQYTDYTDAQAGTDSQWSPYVNNSLTYTYLPGCFVQVGVNRSVLATDVLDPNLNGAAVDQEATTVYATWNHKITSRLTGNVLGQYQRSTFNGGSANGDKDKYYAAGVSLDYTINKNWGLEAGYNYDKLDSDLSGRGYTRDRVYVGVRATY